MSVEQGIHERFAINVGDTMRFDILGRTISARVTSIREVDWRDSRSGGFMFVFRPGALEQAPQTYIAPLKAPNDTAARARFQHDLVEKFPNVSVIDFHEILVTVRDIMSKVTLAISVVGGLVLFSGALILIGAVAMTKFQRIYEAAVLKTLGANTRTIAKMLLFEYGVLGSLAGVVGSLGAVALTWGVSRYALEIPWRFFVGEHVGGVAITAVLVAAIGVLSSLDVLQAQTARHAASGVTRRAPAMTSSMTDVSESFLEHRFALAANGTNVRTEVLAGLTTFLTMAYIIFVQPAVLSAAGMDFGAVLTATCLATAVATLLMALLANYPIAVAPAMGHNFFFAYSVVIGMHVPWRVALGGVAVAGALFIVTSSIGLRERLITAIPASIKHAIARRDRPAHRDDWSAVGRSDRRRAGHAGDAWRPAQSAGPAGDVGAGADRDSDGAACAGGAVMGHSGQHRSRPGAWASCGTRGSPACRRRWRRRFMQFSIAGAFAPGMVTVVFVFFFLALFDSVGTLVGVGSQAGFMQDGTLPRARQALLADAIGTVVGAALGTSTVTAYIESGAGVAAGGRTGLASVVTAALFLLSLFFLSARADDRRRLYGGRHRRCIPSSRRR